MTYLAPMVLHFFLGTIVKLYGLLVKDARQIDSRNAGAVGSKAAIQELADFLGGLENDPANAKAVVADESKAVAEFYEKATSLLDGNRIGEENTPENLGLDDNDQIDAMIYQEGG